MRRVIQKRPSIDKIYCDPLIQFVIGGALTNYLFTGLAAAFISFQWGPGLYGQEFPLMGLVIVLVLLPVQMIISRWWLSKFVFGPFEWLWCYWTYGRPPPMRQNSDVENH
jgi:uncharacterized protein